MIDKLFPVTSLRPSETLHPLPQLPPPSPKMDVLEAWKSSQWYVSDLSDVSKLVVLTVIPDAVEA